MCDYCDCRSHPTIAAFGEDHARIGSLAERATSDAGALAEIVALLERHGAEEEAGLYRELAGVGIEVAHLHDEHEEIHAALHTGEPDRIAVALRRLHAHIRDEEYDLFPAAHQLLDDEAWARLGDRTAHRSQP